MSDIRIRRPEKYEPLMKRLVKDGGVFDTYKDLMVFAACIGFHEGERLSFEKTSEPVSLKIFQKDYDQTIINSIALSEEKDLTILGLKREQEKIKIFEEYLCKGLDSLDGYLRNQTSDEDALVQLLNEQYEEEDDLLGDITNL